MIDLQQRNEWQILDEETGLTFPWYTKSFLDELVTWDLSDKKIFEYSAGHSTIWFSRKCREFYCVEDNIEWFDFVSNELNQKEDGSMVLMSCFDGSKEYINEVYLNSPYDIIIVDGERWRDECIEKALECLTENGILIVDNFDQEEVFIASAKTKLLLKDYQCKLYKQECHNTWVTAMFIK